MACTLPSCFLASDVGGGERKVGGLFSGFPKRGWSGVEWSGVEEKRRECDVWKGRVHVFFMIY